MISVIIIVEKNSAELLAITLENLIQHAVDGFVQEVLIVHDGLDSATQSLADEAGCNFASMRNGLLPACESARGDWLLFVEPGASMETGWTELTAAHAKTSGGAATYTARATEQRAWWKRLFKPQTFTRSMASGLLISKRQARANGHGRNSPLELMRGLAIKRLPAGIYPPRSI